jgi:hypothetical protein
MQLGGLITSTTRDKVKGAENEIHAVLNKANAVEQFERDVAMWYGYCQDPSKGAQLCLRLFSLLKSVGVLYKKADGSWGNFAVDLPQVPVASLLSHGGRILFLLPKSYSATRQVANTIGALVKGVTIDPLKAAFDRKMYKSLKLSGKVGSAVHKVVGYTPLAPVGQAVGAILSTGHKVAAAGDDRIFDCLTGGDLHSRALATHSTIACDAQHTQNLGYNRRLWFTEEKAQGGLHTLSNIRDGMMGRHYYKNVALGGAGNINPFSGLTIDKEGGHGHLYVNYRAPQDLRFGCMLVGVEGSAPGCSDQTGKVHDARAVKGLWSPTGGKKWNALYQNLFFDSQDKDDVTQFVCDLSDLTTSQVVDTINSKVLSADTLHYPIRPVRPAHR